MNLIKMLLGIVLILATLLTLRLAGVFSPTPTPSPAPTPLAVPTLQIEPYKFELGKIELSLVETEVGTPVIVTVPVTNIGSQTNNYTAILNVNDGYMGSKDITLKSGESGNLRYDLKLDGRNGRKLSHSPLRN